MKSKNLIVYYSHSGNTEKAAKLIEQQTGGKLVRIEPEKPYPLDYNAVVDQAEKEIKAGYRPPITTRIDDLEDYDTVFVGSPNWWSTIAPPIAAFLESCDMKGKKIAPFYTHGGGGAGKIERDIKNLCPGSEILQGLGVYGGSCKAADTKAWLNQILADGGLL